MHVQRRIDQALMCQGEKMLRNPIYRILAIAAFARIFGAASPDTLAGTTALMDGSIDATQISPPGAGASFATGTTTYSDGTFVESDWTAGPAVASANSNNGLLTHQQVLSGGNPGAYWQFMTSESASGSASTYHQAFFNNAATYNPAISGPIVGMSGGFSMNLFSYTSIFDVYDASIALEQNGTVYIPDEYYGLQDVAPHWYGSSTLFNSNSPVAVGSSADWRVFSGTGSAQPDFLGNGSVIQFGLMTGGYFDSGSGANTGGLDNWTISVVSALPEPNLTFLVGTTAVFLRRRARKKQTARPNCAPAWQN
jgi:hypothetical protein